jgi:mono/diheme cytochrome c family protein
MLKNKWSLVSGHWSVGKRFLPFAFCLLPFAFLTGCRQDMQDQPKYKAYRASAFFKDGTSSRPLIEGTVARGFLREDKAFYTGKKDGPAQQPSSDPNAMGEAKYPNDVTEFPIPITKEVLTRGKERYTIFCSVCHGPTGNGDGMIVRRGFKQPPSYHTDDLRKAPIGHFFDVETNGWGVMKSYAAQVTPADRWAIIAYIRALQRAQEQGLEKKTAEGAKTGENKSAQPAEAKSSPQTQKPGAGGHK